MYTLWSQMVHTWVRVGMGGPRWQWSEMACIQPGNVGGIRSSLVDVDGTGSMLKLRALKRRAVIGLGTTEA